MATGSACAQVRRAGGHLLAIVLILIMAMVLSVSSMPADAETAPWQSPFAEGP